MTCQRSQTQCESIQQALNNTYPHVQTALIYHTPIQFMVAAILSAQCTDVRVNEVTRPLFEKFSTIEDYAHVSDDELISYIKPCGLYKNKSHNIRACAIMLLERFNGVIPHTRGELMSLPGVGRKTANVVLATIFNIPAVAVDTHVFRVARRIGLSDGLTPDAVEHDLMSAFAEKTWIALHHQIIWHGRLVCKARSPLCSACPINPWCSYVAGLPA